MNKLTDPAEDRGCWLTPAPGLLDPLWRVTVYRRLDGRYVVSCRCPMRSDGTTRRTVLL